MITLANLFQDIDRVCVSSPEGMNEGVCKIVSDSRCVEDGALFVALRGEKQDGSIFVEEAIERGAKAILIKKGVGIPELNEKIIRIECDDPKIVLPILLKRFYLDPCEKIPITGITGTNGKTTTTYFIESIYRSAGKQCGVIGTVNHRFMGKVIPSKNTTPGLVDNFRYLNDMIEAQVNACVMEVSSHALVQGRVRGFTFSEAVFTNLTSDHLDYHEDREAYFFAKAKLFDGSYSIKKAIINADDPFGVRLGDIVRVPVITYGIKSIADVQAEDICLSLEGSQFILRAHGTQVMIKTPFIGKHNIYNILAAASVCLEKGFSLKEIKTGVEDLEMVPGRLERIKEAGDKSILVDYAHTEDALKNVLQSIRETNPNRILTVFGCGGDRDKTKRSKMAAVADEFADFTIVTNDNPRTEDPQQIVEDVIQGFQSDRYEIIFDREKAIAKSLDMAQPGDCVLIAGKGHEDYQIFKDQTIHFDDREVVRKYLKG